MTKFNQMITKINDIGKKVYKKYENHFKKFISSMIKAMKI